MKQLILILGVAVLGVSTANAQHHPAVPYAEVQTINPQSAKPIPQSQGGFTEPFKEPVRQQQTKKRPNPKTAVKKAKKPAVVCPKYFGLHYDRLGRPYCTPIKANKRK